DRIDRGLARDLGKRNQLGLLWHPTTAAATAGALCADCDINYESSHEETRKTIGTLAYRYLARPRKNCSADTATQDCRLDEQLHKSQRLLSAHANEPAVLFRNRD